LVKTVCVDTVEHYVWGADCDGWRLLNRDDFSVIQERVPPGGTEARHYHNESRQFFFVLQGEATIEVDGDDVVLTDRRGIEIPPKTPHRFYNASDEDVVFLVTSVPSTLCDRIVCGDEPK
jgi:mannose-6-phosphate isomerase-like protein (cupin superfamily)